MDAYRNNHDRELTRREKIFSSCLVGVPSLYISALVGIQLISGVMSPKINSHEELEKIIESEKKRAGINENINIDFIFKDDKFEGSSCKSPSGGYTVTLGKESDVSILRHELYHIADGHCDVSEKSGKLKRILRYLLWAEPQATLYQVFGIKL